MTKYLKITRSRYNFVVVVKRKVQWLSITH